MITGLRPDSFKKMQLNAGAFIKNFDYSTATDSATLLALVNAAITAGTNLLGATSGGGEFVAKPEIRKIEADGMRSPIIGSQVNDGWTVKLTGTMKEITPQNFADNLMSATKTVSGKKTTIELRNQITDDDYIDSLVWIGDTSADGFVLIDLKNALNLIGTTFTFTDKGEGTMPFEFTAHDDTLGATVAPCKIVFFDK